jgi:hypothetical protein
MLNQHSPKQHNLVSNRAFLLGVIFYVALVLGAVTVFGGTVSETGFQTFQGANYSGTLLFGDNRADEFERLDWVRSSASHFGALTLHSRLRHHWAPRPNWSGNDRRIFTIPTQIPESPLSRSGSSDPRGTISGTSGSGFTSTDIALGTVSAFASEGISPVPEPATWFAASLVLGAVVWSQRRRLAQLLVGTRKRRILYLAGPFIAVVFTTSAIASENLLEGGDLDSRTQILAANEFLIDRMSDTIGYDNSVEKLAAPSRLLATQPAGQITNINLTRTMNMTVTGGPGATVTLSLNNFLMSGASTFTLQGTATTSFVINVSKQFSLSGSSRIVLSGGVQWNKVAFNVLGKGSNVTLSGSSRLVGVLNASKRMVLLRNQAIVWGEVHAARLILDDSSKVIQPPVISPEQPPAP